MYMAVENLSQFLNLFDIQTQIRFRLFNPRSTNSAKDTSCPFLFYEDVTSSGMAFRSRF
jgi:hypothetical protein